MLGLKDIAALLADLPDVAKKVLEHLERIEELLEELVEVMSDD